MRDLYNNINVVQVANPATATNTVTSSAIDLQGYNSCTVLISVGQSGDTLSGSVYWTLKLTESVDDSSYTDVAASDMLGSQTAVIDSSSEDEAVYKLGYVGSKRYLKAVATKTGTHTNGTPIGIIAVRGDASREPVA